MSRKAVGVFREWITRQSHVWGRARCQSGGANFTQVTSEAFWTFSVVLRNKSPIQQVFHPKALILKHQHACTHSYTQRWFPKNLKRISRADFHTWLSFSTAVTLKENELIFFIAQLVVMKLCLAPNTCRCFPPPSQFLFGCWSHPERMPCFGRTNYWERKRHWRGRKVKEMKGFCCLWCCQGLSVLSVLLFPGSH